jgi:hypothetical protein
MQRKGYFDLAIRYGALYFGALATLMFVTLQALRTESNVIDTALRAAVIFPVMGFLLGSGLWLLLFLCKKRCS